MRRAQQGFTLLELSMVIVLLGFLIGSTVIGYNMIRSAQMHAVIDEVARYTQAINDFRDKFRALPGDFPHATDLWGVAGGDPGGCIGVIGVGSQTCNGDGDGRITTQLAISPLTQYEQFRAWQHLSISALIEGYYAGVPGEQGPQDAVLEFNVPKSKLSGSGYMLISMTQQEAALNTHYFPINYMHMLILGTDTGEDGGNATIGPILTVEEARALDMKQDDGLPGTGKIIAPRKSSKVAPACTDSDDPIAARYDATQELDRSCPLMFLLGF